METSAKRKKQKTIKYKKVTFKITDKQKKIIERVCKKQKITSNRLIKKAILEYLSRYANLNANEEIVSKNQLKLFDDEEDDLDFISFVADETSNTVKD